METRGDGARQTGLGPPRCGDVQGGVDAVSEGTLPQPVIILIANYYSRLIHRK